MPGMNSPSQTTDEEMGNKKDRFKQAGTSPYETRASQLPLTPRRFADDLEAGAIGKVNLFTLIGLPANTRSKSRFALLTTS